MIVPLYSTKGGCGKSTLAVCLAAYWSQTRKTALLDADPQASLSPLPAGGPARSRTRYQQGRSQTIAKLAGEYERVVIDTGHTAGARTSRPWPLRFCADPMQALALRPAGSDGSCELLREIAGGRKGTRPRYAVVLTMAQRTAVSAQIREDLRIRVPFMSAQIGQRVAFVETPSIGFRRVRWPL